MSLLIGFVVVIGSVIGGFVLGHGHLGALWQPNELVIIGGAAVGAFVIGNSPTVIFAVLKGLPALVRGPRYRKREYMELLALLHELFGKARKEGLLGLEQDIEDPAQSPVFCEYPRLLREHHLIEFIQDNVRLVVGGNISPLELETLMDVEIDTHHTEAEQPGAALTKLADSLPGFGIVAAVLGIVVTMASLNDGDAAMIGAHVAGALVGTFLGILLAYGFVGPAAAAMESLARDDGKALECIKVGILAMLQGYPPQLAVELARKTLFSTVRPSFAELDGHLRGQR